MINLEEEITIAKREEEQYCHLCKPKKILAHTVCFACGKGICLKHGKAVRGADNKWIGYCCDKCRKTVEQAIEQRIKTEEAERVKREEEWNERVEDYEKRKEQWIKELKPKLTDEFLDTFILAVKVSGWKWDDVDIDDWVEFIYKLAEKDLPNEKMRGIV